MFLTGLIILFAGGYFGYRQYYAKADAIRYVTATVERGMLVSSISGSGQVSASNEADIKSEVSGEVLRIYAVSGQEVTSSTVIAEIDDRDAQKELRDARSAYDSAKSSLDDMIAPPDELVVAKAESALSAAKRDLLDLVHPSEDTIGNAKDDLASAREDLAKLKNDQAKGLKEAQDAKEEADDNLTEAYEDAVNTMTSAFFDLPAIISDLDDILYSTAISDSETTLTEQNNKNTLINSIDFNTNDDSNLIRLKKFIATAEADYDAARESYDSNFENYRDIKHSSPQSEIEMVLEETVATARAMADAVKSEGNMLDYWVDCYRQMDLRPYSQVTAYQSDIQSYTSKINTILTNVVSALRSLDDAKQAIIDAADDLDELKRDQPIDLAEAERKVKDKQDALDELLSPEQYEIDDLELAVKEKEAALADVKAGADATDIRIQRISVQNKYEALQDALEKVARCKIKAPFDGRIASIDVAVGDTVNSGSLIATAITNEKIVDITLNEIDIASIAVGQNATIGFDAVSDLTATGKVIELDTVGAVNQGVVSYNVKVSFDVQDDRIKPGMSTSVAIITDSKQEVLSVPVGAIKTAGTGSYVEVLVNGEPQRKTVTTGISNDTNIEITDGLSESDEVITQTINSNSQTTTSSQNTSNFRGPGGGFMMIR